MPDKPNNLASWIHAFAHRGRVYRLFKRVDSKVAPYYLRIQRAKTRHKQSLETPVQTVAVRRAKQLIDLTFDSKWEQIERLKTRHRVANLEQVLKVYRQIHGIKRRSARNNELAILLMIRRCTGKNEVNPRHVSLAYLDKSFPIRFQDITAADYCAGLTDEGALREARELAYRSSRSTINQARSLFSRRPEHDLTDRYKLAGLSIPDCVTDFMTVKLRGKIRKSDYHPPGDSVIKLTFERIEEVKEFDPNLYKAFWLDVGAGLRRGEIPRVDWSHFIQRDGFIWISGGVGKDGERIEVPVQSKAWKALHGFQKSKGRVIEGESIEWSKRLNNWLRCLGWTTEKKMHELRAYIGSLIYQQNPNAAMKFMRHKSFKVTEQFYVRYGSGKPVDVL
jgi:integrase